MLVSCHTHYIWQVTSYIDWKVNLGFTDQLSCDTTLDFTGLSMEKIYHFWSRVSSKVHIIAVIMGKITDPFQMSGMCAHEIHYNL